jgi:sugar/nucleoside kinase (ribokinase family)
MDSDARRYDVVTFGDLCVDVVLSGRDVTPQFGQVEKLVDDYTVEMGGSCSIFACQAARLGLRVGILGRVGPDDFGRLILRRMNESGVDTSHVIVDPNLKTGMGVALCRENDRAILTYLGSISAIRPDDVTDEFIGSARHLHHGSFFLHTQLRPHVPAIFLRARALGMSVSLDTNWDPADQWGPPLPETLSLTDVLMPNDQEALRISRCANLKDAVTWFQARGVRVITIKKGVDGAEVHSGAEQYHLATTPVTGGDSIGAGDSFDAGFLAGWLRGMPLEQCLRLGCICGRGVAAKAGGVEGQPTWETVTQSHQQSSP